MIEMTGKRIGRWLVLGLAAKQQRARCTRWLCRCDCGIEKDVDGQSLRRGVSTSCGCFREEIKHLGGQKNRRHGQKKTPEWQAWCSMRYRCENPKNANFRNYGARGIKVCERWKVFENFIADVGTRPSKRHSLDRVNNDGNYEPENVRWAVSKEQLENKRDNHIVTAFGRTGPLSSFFAGRSDCIEYDRALQRINRFGWMPEDAISLLPLS